MEKTFLINEVASLHNMSKKTLLYYDQIGLFKPHHIDEDTGYRYYVRQQFPYLKQIMYLKDLGFALNEIQCLLEDRRFSPLISQLRLKLEDVNEELKILNHRKHDLEYLIDFYDKTQHIDERDLNRPGIKLIGERTMIYEVCEKDNNATEVMLAYRKLLRKLLDFNLFSQMPYGTIALEPTPSGGDYYDNVGSFITIDQSLGLEDEIVAPCGKYAYMYKKGGYYDSSSVKKLVAWCVEQGYTPVGNVYDHCLVDYTFSKSDDEMIQEIQVRIE